MEWQSVPAHPHLTLTLSPPDGSGEGTAMLTALVIWQ